MAVVSDTNLPIFYQDWWLDAVTGGRDKWGMAKVYDKQGKLAGVWPFFRKKRLLGLLPTLDKPPFSLFCGPLVFSCSFDMKADREISRQHHVLGELEKQLPLVSLARAMSPYAMTNLWPLAKSGWQIRQYYSYRLRSDHYSATELWDRLSGRVRTDLRKSDKRPDAIRPINDPDLFIELNRKVMNHRHAKAYFPEGVFTRIYQASFQQKSAKCWAYFNENNQPLAMIWLPFDDQSAYLIGAASDPDDRNDSKAITKLIWHAVNWCITQKIAFDFEGSDLPGVEEYYRSFGPEVTGYLGAQRIQLPWKKRTG